MKIIGFVLLLSFVFYTRPEAQTASSSTSPQEEPVLPHTIVSREAYREVLASGRYLVGQGDRFIIYESGMGIPHFSAVLLEGGLFIPRVGIVKVGGLNLSETRKAVEDAFNRVFKKGSTIDIELFEPRRFRVTVLGAVSNPGTKLATGIERMSEVVFRAEGVGSKASRRNIRVIKSDSLDAEALARMEETARTGNIWHLEDVSRRVDLDYYGITGETRYNPFVEDGDFIIVGQMEGRVLVQGAVQRPGSFEYVRGDRINDMLVFAQGLTPNYDLDKAELFRYKEDNKTMYTQKVDLRGVLAKDPAADLELQPGDELVFRAIKGFKERSTVSIGGEVHHPGVYVIDKEGTTFRQAISIAGGFTQEASLADARIVRPPSGTELQDPEFERVAAIPVGDRTEEDDQYFIMKSRERPGKMVVDIEALYVEGNEAENIVLEPGDVIDVPPLRRIVTVGGQAANPGVVLYDSTFGVWDYIDKAGGFGWKASKEVMVIKGHTGERKRAKDVEQINPGDRIWIKQKPEREYWLLFTQTMGVVGQISTVVLLFVTLTR